MRRLGRPALAALILAATLVSGAVPADLLGRTDVAAAADAPATTWTPAVTNGGGWVTGLVTAPAGGTYSRTDVGGAYRWDETTQTWTQMLTTSSVASPLADDYSVESIAVAPSDGRVVYVAAGGDLAAAHGRILRSADGGRTWRDGGKRFPIDGNAEWRWGGERLSVDPANPDVVMFGSRTEGLWRSEDGGASWVSQPVRSVTVPGDPAGVSFTIFDPASPVVAGRSQGAWAGVQNVGVLRTDDAGRSWRLVHAVANGVPRDAEVATNGVLFVAVNGSPSQVVRIDPRAGSVAVVSPSPGGAFAMVAVDPANPDRIFVGDDGVRDGALWRSLDGGRSWAALDIALASSAKDVWSTTTGIDGWMSGGALAFDPLRPGHLWFAEGMGMWRTTDLGDAEVTWTFTSTGIEELVSNAAVKPPGKPLITASWDRGLFRHPSPSTGGAYPPHRREFGSAWDVASSPTDASFLAAVLDDHQDLSGRWRPERRASGYSTDGGATWTRFAALANGTAPSDMLLGNIAISANDNDNLVWVPSRLMTAKVYYTRDRGGSWAPSTLHGQVAGDYLHPAHFLKREVLTADTAVRGTFYALGGNNSSGSAALWKTTDGGANWSKTGAQGLGRAGWWDFRYNSSLLAVPGRPGLLIASAGRTDDASRPFWRSTDGGATWVQKSTLINAHGIGVGAPMTVGGNPTIFTFGTVAGRQGVHRSSDFGDSWTFMVDNPRGWYQPITAIAGDPDVPGKVYVGFSGGGFVVGETVTAPAAPTTTAPPAPTTTAPPAPTTTVPPAPTTTVPPAPTTTAPPAPTTTVPPAPTTTTVPPTTTVAPAPARFVTRINSGGDAVTEGGFAWVADRSFVGGRTWDSGAVVTSTAPVTDRSERVGLTGYAIPVPAAGEYAVRLHVTELYYSSAGARVFDVAAEGRPFATAVDPFAAAGGRYRTKVLERRVMVTDGTLDLRFVGRVDLPSVTGIEVLALVTPPPPVGFVTRINSGGGAVTEGGAAWVADRSFVGGRAWDSGAVVTSPSPVTDRSERVGLTGYAIPVPAAGEYVVRLHVTELYYSSVGARVFDVTAEGRPFAAGVDAFAAMGKDRTQVVERRVTVTDGTLDLGFVGRVDLPSVTGVEVLGA